MLASVKSLAAAAEQRLASRRSNYFEAGGMAAKTNEKTTADTVGDFHNNFKMVKPDLAVDIFAQRSSTSKMKEKYVYQLMQLLPNCIITSLGWPGVDCLIHDIWST